MNAPTITLALAKAVSADDLKVISAEVAEGIHHVDATIRIHGTLKKGKPFETTVPAAVDPWALLRRALSKLSGVTVEALVREVLENPEEPAEIADRAKAAIATLVASTKRTMPGRVTGQISFEVVAS